MEYPGAAAGGAAVSGGNVPAFLTKLWTLVEDPDTDSLIRWSPSGASFHVFDHGRFSKEVLPKFFKHNNMASFIRQLNMYGFRKVVHIEQGGLVKPERDDTEFQHPFFLRGQEQLLENIKRKVTTVSSARHDEAKISTDEVNKILNDVQLMKGKQENIDSRILAMKHENEALWREVANLRQKHANQQKVVNKLIHFLVSLVQTNRILGVKRKIPLMLSDSSSTHSLPKYSRPFSLEQLQATSNVFSADSPRTSGPIISDITDVDTPTTDSIITDWTDPEVNPLVDIKVEKSSPEVEVYPIVEQVVSPPVDTPLSPTTFINSILEDETPTTAITSATSTPTANPIVVMSPASTGPLPSAVTSQSAFSATTANSPTTPQQKCQTVACIDRPRPLPSTGGLTPEVRRFLSTHHEMSELCSHVDSIDSGLENLHNMLNNQAFSFDTSPLMEFFSSPCPPGEFDLDSLDTLLSDDVPKGSDESSTGKQLVQYMPMPPGEGMADLLEEPLFNMDTPTTTDDLLSHSHVE